MKKYFLMTLSCLVLLNNAYAKAIEVFNPCTQEQVALTQILSNKNILLDKTVSLNDTKMFLISYLDQAGEICMQKRYDVFFKKNGEYIYSTKLFDELDEVFPSIDVENDMFIIDLEYGNGQANLERYYLKPSGNNIFLIAKENLETRNGKGRKTQFDKKDISSVKFSKFINTD